MSVRPSVRMEQFGCHWKDFHWIWYLNNSRKTVQKVPVSLKSDKNNGYFTWRPLESFDSTCISLHFFVEWEIFQTGFVEEIETHVLCSITFCRKSYSLWDNVEKYHRAGQATDNNMAHAHCMLDTYGYKQTLRICNTYYLSTGKIVRTRLHVTYIRTLPVL